MRVVVTGGSGHVGRHVIAALLAEGHQVLNIDLHMPSEESGVYTIITDLTDSGQVLNALTSPFQLKEPFDSQLPTRPDAIVHLAGIARNLLVPDNELFRINTISTYNVVEIACKLGIPKIILASSITVYGVTYATGRIDFPSFPVDEDVDCDPMDCYAISKLCGERVARGFARKFGNDIYVLRIGAVFTPLDYANKFPQYVSHPFDNLARAHGWSYSDADDLGSLFVLALNKSGLGFQIFNATNDSITNNAEDSNEFLAAAAPRVPFTRDMGSHEAPCTNRKARKLLGFREKHSWQDRLGFAVHSLVLHTANDVE